MGAVDDSGCCSRENAKGWLCCLSFLLLVVGLTLTMVYATPSKNYYVSIDSVSGLDFLIPGSASTPTPTGTDLALSPAFNLTLRVNSGSPGRRACLDVRTYIEVYYRCVPLAATLALPEDLCVGPKKSADWRVVARGVGVRLPGFLVDGLAADARSGVEAFDVVLRRAGEDGYGESCGVRRVGDAVRPCGSATGIITTNVLPIRGRLLPLQRAFRCWGEVSMDAPSRSSFRAQDQRIS